MEWLKQASLRTSLFVIIIIFGVTGAGIVYLTLFILNNMVPYCCICRTPFSSLRWILPVVASVSMPILAVTTFYRLKLESPLSQLEAGTKRVMKNDLDFSITIESEDELGKLCQSFEFMRIELLRSNLEMQQKMEERKRLNAAFAHDLRNPVTVLSGSAKVLQAKLDKGDLTSQSIEENISLISQYTKRIESYIQAMTSVQKLEEIALVENDIYWSSLVKELESSLSLLAQEPGKTIEFTRDEDHKQLFVDQHVIHNVAENLVSNALRFSKSKITVQLILEKEEVALKVSDDGPGFSKTLLEKGVVPFMRDASPTLGQHFGMGLYISHLLCKKHEGQLTLANHSKGGEVTATFKYRAAK